ncbi:helix-turn-helix domain-containing protein [Pseudoclavibacter chungangensis]|uniref:Helix-turn-helix domain-containing protein n=1 Tax=Pseudoclavibacter chungangensis TaxID=587635 RepID=A0A7J5C086_9MICO|nr:helix-turn-helix domain-containing protein [Pseudoclavibacter chungangensis]KAB1660314.1 helix-turn-helix domain-containing protein [Pseudoclavibacter chungangensis]NYJ65669.1 transcriptional regulator with XRE-family HTH domain [Pseudoclavibacter chungangensis]
MRPVQADPNDRPVAIGARLRNARTALGLTLAQVAEASGVTKGFLSRVERDETSPSVATLVGLCQVLSVPMGALFVEPEIQVVRAGTAPRINLGGRGVTEHLVSARSESELQIVRSTMAADATGGDELYTISSTVEVLLVLSGEIVVRFIDREIELSAGDSITFPGREPHSWRTGAEQGAEVVWCLSPAAWRGTV